MQNLSRIVLAFIALAVSCQLSSAASMADVAKAQAIINKINQVVEKYREMTIQLEAPASLDGGKGEVFGSVRR